MALILTGKYDTKEISNQDEPMESTTIDNELEQKTTKQLSDLAEKVQKLNDDTVQLSCDFVKLNELCQGTVQDINNFQTIINERNIEMSNLQSRQDSIQQDIEQLKQKFEENQYVSTDGTLLWRVDNVAERISDAQSERQSSILSPVFYSDPNGYKMRACLYLLGDGDARKSHMSVFFLLVKGEYDSLLSWPFKYKVTFCLFDQTGNKGHIIDSFHPDTKSSSFQRPTNESNIPSGIPKFLSLTTIQHENNAYVRDDTLFLKIIVDFDEKPKLILPFMLGLNPGLPIHVRMNLIHQEKDKQVQ